MLRWEYMPGSALFVVWTQDRSEEDGRGEFRFGANAKRLFKAQPNNMFLVKASYDFNL